MVFKLANGTLIVVNVSAKTIDTVNAIRSHFKLTFIKELLLLLTQVTDDANSANLGFLFVVFSIFDFTKLLHTANTEFGTKPEITLIKQLFEVQLVLFQIIEEEFITLFANKYILGWHFKHFLDNFVLVSWFAGR